MFKKLRLFFIYLSILNKNKDLLKIEHDISIDFAWRLYKTYTIPFNELEDIRKFGYKYFNTMLRSEISKIDKTFLKLGLSELVTLMEAKELNENQVGLAFKFKHLDTTKIVSRLLWLIFTAFMSVIGYFAGKYLGLTIGLFITFILYVVSRFI